MSVFKRPVPRLWVSLRPNGVGLQKPHHYREMVRVAWQNRRHPIYAWRVLTRGACDGCALGVAGLHDWTIDGVHLCTTRLRLLEVNTADPIPAGVLEDVAPLQSMSGAELRALGRLAHPMRRRAGERGFTRISWPEALDAIGAAQRAALDAGKPERIAWYLTSRGLTNETYYTAAKASRALGIANIDSAARVCHAPSTVGLKQTVGVAATTCSLQDVLESDLIVIWGANPGANQPVFMKYLYLARRRGTRVVVVNPYLEPALERYWVPSNVESALFGTKMCDLHVPVRPGGDVALANALVKALSDRNAVDRAFIDAHTSGWDELVAHLAGQTLDSLLGEAGVERDAFDALVDEYASADAAILLWAMGITQRTDSVDGVRGIVNVALARGNVGRNGAGLMPLRGHSGVQGGAEMGAYATAFPGGVTVDEAGAELMSERWGFTVPSSPGVTAAEMLEAAERGELDVLFSSGGNFRDVLPDPPRVTAALATVPLRVHADIIVSSQMLVPADDVILLPVRTRYEQEGGGTETTTERRIAFSPEIPRQVGEARSEWRLYGDLVAHTRPELGEHFSWADNRTLRQEIAAVVPLYSGIETLGTTGDAVQWGGRHLCAGGEFPLPDGRARFSSLDLPRSSVPEGKFSVTTRRGKQFNSMIFDSKDPLTGLGRHDVLIDRADAMAEGIAEGDRVRLSNATGSFVGCARLGRLATRSLQVHWPEGNVLVASGPEDREPRSGVPDYNAFVTIEVLDGTPVALRT